MSLGICFEYTLNGYHRTQWLQLVSAFKPDFAYERTGRPVEDEDRKDILDAARVDGTIPVADLTGVPHRDMRLVVLSPQSAREVVPTIALPDFNHPENAMYYFGGDREHTGLEDLESWPKRDVVYIPTLSDREQDEFWSVNVGGIVLYDRMARSWQ